MKVCILCGRTVDELHESYAKTTLSSGDSESELYFCGRHSTVEINKFTEKVESDKSTHVMYKIM